MKRWRWVCVLPAPNGHSARGIAPLILWRMELANSKGSNDRKDATRNMGHPDAQSVGNRDQQSQQSGAMGEPGQGVGSNSTTSVGSSGNYGSGGQQGQRDTGGKQQDQGARSEKKGQDSDQRK
jgi:hypothetical protein